MFPSWIQDRIVQVTAGYSSPQLATAYKDLSWRYRSSGDKRGFRSSLEVMAYIGARLPATFACIQRCLNELPGGYSPASTLDIGCGPGTATLACLDRFENLNPFLIEENADMVSIGQQLIPSGQWQHHNILTLSAFPKADLVLFSYVLNEIPLAHHHEMVTKLWAATTDYLLIITPGTPHSFMQLKQARQYLIEEGAHLIAPCPHAFVCPMIEQDWCHFTQRLNRSSHHKNLKGAEIGYEDEKFSYLLVSKHPQPYSYQRVIKQPQHRSGHGTVDLCTPDGTLECRSYSKSKSKDFQQLKKLTWGERY
jgi:ribosomal protein RSM22 (predicted rRNA methylase)